MNNMQIPAARSENLVIQELPEEVLVYDLDTNKAHCLNQTAGFVWKACDGKNSIADIVQSLETQTGNKVPEDLVWLAIDQLNERNLLNEKVTPKFAGENRRQVLKKIGLASIVALPIVASLVAPSAALAVACSGVVASCTSCPDGTPCMNAAGGQGMCAGGNCV